MANKITVEQIETARTAFRNGKSIPEACALAHMSRASFNKYLGNEIKVWMAEHEAAKQRDRIDEIVPKPVSFNVVMTDELIKDVDDNKIMLAVQQEQHEQAALEQDQQMSDEDFYSVLDYEFSNCNSYDEARETYYLYKPTAIINIRRVEYFRKVYEQTLDRVSGKPKATTTTTKRPKVEPKATNNENSYGDFRLAWASEVNELNSRFNADIKKINKKRHINWSQTRYLAHIYYWLRLKASNTSDWIGISRFNKLESDEERRALVNELVSFLEAEQ